MSTSPTEPTHNPTPTPGPKPTEPAKPPAPARTFTQDEVNAFLAEDKRKERDALVAKYGDLDQLKSLADAQKAADEAAKTELQREKERADKAEADALIARREAFAAAKGVPASMVTGGSQEEWESSATAALEWKGAQAEVLPAPPAPTAHAAGNNGAPAGSSGDIDAQIAEAEKARNFSLAIALKQRKYAAARTN